MNIVTCRRVSVEYSDGTSVLEALAAVELAVADAETLAIVGRSGSGKTTLLYVLGGLVAPSSGTVDRAGKTALVFQGANLLPHFTAFENVSVVSDGAADAERLLTLVGLAAKLDHLPGELSGGEAQRVAIARALAQRPDLLLCDEPTGHLDSDTAARVLDLIDALQLELRFALVIATHDRGVAARCSRTLTMLNGRIVE